MANHKSVLKRHKQSLQQAARNRAMRTRIKNAVKKVHQAVEENNAEQAASLLVNATSVLNKAAGKKVIHWKKAARKVSRLAKIVNKVTVQA